MPVRVAKPENLVGLVDQIQSPAFSTSVGLLKWAELMNETSATTALHISRRPGIGLPTPKWDDVKEWLKRLLP
jgi:cell division protein FtsA